MILFILGAILSCGLIVANICILWVFLQSMFTEDPLEELKYMWKSIEYVKDILIYIPILPGIVGALVLYVALRAIWVVAGRPIKAVLYIKVRKLK